MSHGLTPTAGITRAQLESLRKKPAHVIGAASAEGVAITRLLLQLNFQQIVLHDMRERSELRRAFRTVHGAYAREEQDAIWEQLRELIDAGHYGVSYLDGIEEAALVSLGQGWYLDETNRTNIVARVPSDAVIVSMSELYFALHRGPIAAITGTNGKSTTTAIAEHIMAAAGVDFRSSGNERSSRQFLPEVDQIRAGTWALLEVSNRQLLQVSRSPHVAAITALTPDHLEEHGGWEGYRATKALLFSRQSDNDIAIVNANDTDALSVAEESPAALAGRMVRCGIGVFESPSVSWRDGVLIAEDVPYPDGQRHGQIVLATEADIQMPGEHNLRNAAVAAAVSIACGADPAVIGSALRSFEGKALRLQQLAVVDDVTIWSDIKSTTPEATIAAVSAFDDQRPYVIVGGEDKGLNYSALAVILRQRAARVFAVPGSATDSLEREIELLAAGDNSSDISAVFERVDGLESALDHAFDAAASGDVVIVSPAAAGFWSQELQGKPSLKRLVQRRARALEESSER